MRFSTLKSTMVNTLKANPAQVFFIDGAPGGGKTTLTYEVAQALGIPDNRVLVFRPSLHDPVDLLGIPHVHDGHTTFCPPEELARFGEGSGPGMIIWDELPQGVSSMQNAIAGLILDKFAGNLRLDPQVVQIATGNRTEDRAGANRVVGQLSNRWCNIHLDTHVDDWSAWAVQQDYLESNLIAFLRLRADLLHDYRADRGANPTPRSWEMVGKLPESLPSEAYLEVVTGLVGDGAAAEWVAARKLMAKMPSIDDIMMQPDKAEVPTEPAILYAVAGALANRANPVNFDTVMTYVGRLPPEFGVLTVKDSIARNPAVKFTKALMDWAVKNQNVFL